MAHRIEFEIDFHPGANGPMVIVVDLASSRQIVSLSADSPHLDLVVVDEIGRSVVASIRKALEK